MDTTSSPDLSITQCDNIPNMQNIKKSNCDLQQIHKDVVFCYHFFPHYRKGVIKKLHTELPATFIGDSKGVEGIKTYAFPNNVNFIPAKCIYFGKIMIQPTLILESLTGPYSTYVFLANPNHITTWLAAAICRLRRKRVIFWGHGFKSSEKTTNNKFRKIFFSLAHAFYTYGYNAKKNAITLGFNEKNTYVGFNSLDYETQLPIRLDLISQPQKTDKPIDTLTIACISRITHTCRYDMLLDAISLAKKYSTINYNIIMIGDGPERASLEEKAKKLGVNIRFLGSLYEERKIAEILYNSDVTISPGKIGLTAMHSLMYGTPVISHNNFISQMPEVEAIVPGFTGDLFNEDDINDLAKILTTFPARFPDRNQTRKYCFAMIDQVYNPSRQIEVLKQAINRIPASCGDDAFSIFKEGSSK